MNIQALLFSLLAALLAVAELSTNSNDAKLISKDVSFPCTPSNNPNQCILVYSTNFGQLLDTLNQQTYFAEADLYEPTCGAIIGSGTISNEDETITIFAMQLSWSNPVKLGTQRLSYLVYSTPVWSYGGANYDNDDCTCQMSVGTKLHWCVCQFYCDLWQLN